MNPDLPLFNSNSSNPSEDLEFNFQSLNLSNKEEVQIDFEDQSQEHIPTPYNLLFKVGPPNGPVSRSITIQMFEKAMRSAWGRRFYRVTQIVPNLFMAHFREEDDLRWIWQRQPWTAERETMLVEWIDPKGGRPMESYTFRYLPVTIHLYGIPKSLRSVELVDKIVEKIGVKDKSIMFSESSMFRVPEYVLARVILDVTKPLLDSVTISISMGKKIKVYVHYEKLVKVCNFCGHLFHNVSSCLKKQQILWKLSPSEAAKVPDEVYGKWRTQEQDIPMEAREEQENKSHNAYIQSFKDFFQKSAGFSNSSDSSDLEIGSSSSQATNLQLMIVQNNQTPSNSATEQKSMDIILQSPEGAGEQAGERGKKGNMEINEASGCSLSKFQLGPGTQAQQSILGPFSTQGTGVINFQAQQVQTQTPPWQFQVTLSQNKQGQQQMNPFVSQGMPQQNFVSSNYQSTSSVKQMQESFPSTQLPALPPPDIITHPFQQLNQNTSTGDKNPSFGAVGAGSFYFNQGPFQPPHWNPSQRKNRLNQAPSRKVSHGSVSYQPYKRQGSPLSPPSSKRPTSPPFTPTPRSPSPSLSSPPILSTPYVFPQVGNQSDQNMRQRKRSGNHPSRWDQEAKIGDEGKHLRLVDLPGGDAQDERSYDSSVLRSNPSDGDGLQYETVQVQNQDSQGNDQGYTEDAHDAALPSLVADDGALAPALKAPRAP